MALAAYGGLEAMNSAETKPKELRLGKPCAGKPLARFDEGEGSVCGLPLRCALYSTTRCLMFGCPVAGAMSVNGRQVFIRMNENWYKVGLSERKVP